MAGRQLSVVLDVESDGDADFLIGSLDGPDRLLVNDGSGVLGLEDDVFDTPVPSRGTLGMGIADLDDDGRPDVVESQGEATGYEDERIYLGTDALAPDTAPPVVASERVGRTVFARVNDNRTPNMPYQWDSITVAWGGDRIAMHWYGENLFTAELPRAVAEAELCAVDVVGNKTCEPVD